AGSVSSASITNGRLMAVCSQIAALSAQRRRAGEPDVRLPGARLGRSGESGMAGLLAIASKGLDPYAARWLRAASAAKLMELSGYRPYELESSDCRFISEAMADLPSVPVANKRDLGRMRAATAARLLRLGRVADALTLATPALWPEIAARAGS